MNPHFVLFPHNHNGLLPYFHAVILLPIFSPIIFRPFFPPLFFWTLNQVFIFLLLHGFVVFLLVNTFYVFVHCLLLYLPLLIWMSSSSFILSTSLFIASFYIFLLSFKFVFLLVHTFCYFLSLYIVHHYAVHNNENVSLTHRLRKKLLLR